MEAGVKGVQPPALGESSKSTQPCKGYSVLLPARRVPVRKGRKTISNGKKILWANAVDGGVGGSIAPTAFSTKKR